MTENELHDLLEKLRRFGGDHFTCEVKRSQGGLPASMWETVSAFANAQGGLIILGVDEKSDFTVVGVNEPAKVEANLAAVCSEMEPPVRAEMATVELDGHHVILCQIPPTPRDQRPCHKKDRGPWAGSRLRVSDGDRKLTDYEVSVLLSNRSEQRQDLRPITESSLSDLDGELIRGFLRRVRETKSPIFSRIDDDEALRMLNVLVKHEDKLVPSLAGLLVFGVYPQQFEPQLDITFVAYPTPEAGVLGPSGERFTENRSIDGPIPQMVSECIRTLKRNMKRRSIVSGLYRTDEWEYPEEVLREALVNALVHRDYSEFARGMQVQVEMYPDRLMIRNPGGLYGPVEVNSLGTETVSSSRNKVLLKILEDTPYSDNRMVCENRGSGIARIRISLTEAGMEPPRFIDDISSFTAEFPNHTLIDNDALAWLGSLESGPLSRPQMTALVMMRNGQAMTNSSYRAATGVQDSRAASRDLKDLVDRGIAEQFGTRGSAFYTLAGEHSAVPEEGLFGDLIEVAVSVSATVDQEDAESTPTDAAVTDLQSAVLASLSEGDLHRLEIEEKTGFDAGQVRGALQALREKGLVELVGKPRSRNARWRAR
ncbi:MULTISPECIES: ATP-binding protein [Streptomyces]|uniref:ATP-binding protein n=2 Tax=Streptomyces TaxID=1883 RepID=A0ABU4K2X2_9ACTN|nr:ATP-binding protein [Streptomyces roseolus]MDX2292073.1 ATP-binding protein [Streptomyces roseolus]